MSAIYSVNASDPANGLVQQWSGEGLSPGYSSLVPVQVGGKLVLFAFNKTSQQLDAFVLSAGGTSIDRSADGLKLQSGPWDNACSFVLGNVPYLLAYRADTGQFGFFAIANDLSMSPPYIFTSSHTTPSVGFTTVVPYTSLSGQYILGYDFKTGRVENFSVSVIPTSADGVPPLLALNVWYHLWARGWTQFSFFQLGGSNFFFKINTVKLNVNIDHMQDNPAMGSIEVGSLLQSKMPDAPSITSAAIVPWANGEPYLFTYIASSGSSKVYRIHSNCLGWDLAISATTVTGATIAVPYRIGNISYVLLYQDTSLGGAQ